MEVLFFLAVLLVWTAAGALAGFLKRSLWLGAGLSLLGVAVVALWMLSGYILPSEGIGGVPPSGR